MHGQDNPLWNTDLTETVELENRIRCAADETHASLISPERSRAEAKKALASAGDWTPRLHRSSTQGALISPSTPVPSLGRSRSWRRMLPEAAFSRAESDSDIGKVNMNSNRISDGDHSTLLSSLSGDDRQGHASQSDEAFSTQKQLKDEMSADLVDARKAEEDCKTNRAALIAAERRRSPVQQGRRDQRVQG